MISLKKISKIVNFFRQNTKRHLWCLNLCKNFYAIFCSIRDYNIFNMIVLSGASASGKTEVAKMLASKYGITKVITTTTRKIRVNEVDGRDYFFVSKERFLEMIKEDRFVEYTSYSNNYYGSTKDQIKPNRCVVIDPNGLQAYISLHDPNIITFFLEADEETRYKRMLERGDNEDDARARIINDKEIFKLENVKNVDYLIDSENFNVEDVADHIYKIYMQRINS